MSPNFKKYWFVASSPFLGAIIGIVLSLLLFGCSTRMYNIIHETNSPDLYQRQEEECNAAIEKEFSTDWKNGGEMKFRGTNDTTESCMETKGWIKTY